MRPHSRMPGVWAAVVVAAITSQTLGGSALNSVELPLPQTCKSGNYFDFSGMQCSSCPQGQLPARDGLSCVCKAGSIPGSDGAGHLVCTSCMTSNLAPSSDGLTCMACDATSGAVLDTSAGDCTCPSGMALTELNAAGTRLSTKTCVTCPSTSYVSASQPQLCQVCPSGTSYSATLGSCQCPAGTDGCSSDSGTGIVATATSLGVVLSSSNQVTFYDIPTSTGGTSTKTVSSYVFTELIPMATKCWGVGDRQSCNAIANLCVLQLYDKSSVACKLYTALSSKRASAVGTYDSIDNWAVGMPWLYYSTSIGDATSWLRRTDVQSTVSFKHQVPGSSSVGDIVLVTSRYALNGTWLGFRNVSTKFQLCSMQAGEASAWVRFGTNYINTCQLDFTQIADIEPEGEPIFYDVYFLDGSHGLYPLPLYVQDYREQGVLVNSNQDPTSASNTVLTRRFFLTDFVSGKASTAAAPQAVRYAQSIQLTIMLHSSARSRIYPPYLTIKYATRDPVFAETVPNPASFSVIYTMASFKFWSVWTIMLIVVAVIGFFLWCLQMYRYTRKRDDQNFDLEFLLRCAVEGAVVMSRLFFLLALFGSAYWFVFFKLQAAVFVMMPQDADASLFRLVVLVAFVCQLVVVVDIVWRQSHYDIFFVDWEKPRMMVGTGGAKEPAPISVWRTLFVANEWAELQVRRQTRLELTLVTVLLFLSAIGLEGLTTIQPSIGKLTVKPYDETSCILRFFIATFFWLVITAVQMLWVNIIVHNYVSHPITEFVDLMSLANLSVFIFESKLCGFYLHGRSLMPFSDTSMYLLNQELRKEQEGVVSHRGLVPHSTRPESADTQTFQVFITNDLRSRYDGNFLRRVEESKGRPAQQPSKGHLAGRRFDSPADATVKAQLEVASLFRNFVNQVEADAANRVKPKTFLQRLLDLPPDMALLRTPIFYYDTANQFARVTFYGVETDLIIFNILVFAAVDLALKNVAASVFATYVVERLLVYVRSWAGDRNISNKALVDPRFLI